jgi:trigger factor
LAEDLIVTSSPRDDHQLDLTIQLGPERSEQALERAARLVAKQARIPGFRPGKAPVKTVLRMYGKEAVLGEIVDDLGQEVYKEVLAREEFAPYGQAALEDVQTEPVTFKLVVPLRPTVDLGDYTSIRLDPSPVEVTDADVDAALEQARAARMTVQTVERPAELGDVVRVDITGHVGENQIMDNHDWELTLRGESGWLPGFDEAFVGLRGGEEKDFELTYPEDSVSRYKGQTANFHVSVKEVKSKTLPEVTDEFVKELGEYENVADYRAQTMEGIRKQRQAEADTKYNDDLVEALVSGATISYPHAAVHDTIHELIHDMERRLQNIGYTLQDSLRLQGKTIEQYEQELEPIAERRLKGRLALVELGVRENIEVTEADVQAELDRIAGQAEDEATGIEIRRVFGEGAGLEVVRNDVLTEKTLTRLKAIAAGQTTAGPQPASEETVAVDDAVTATGDELAETPAPVSDEAVE